jgi:flavin reductase (DIM6/NTAB) family NADH-FMN oxidoreductase RutF
MNGSTSSSAFREALAHFATGVTVITAQTASSPAIGLTVSAFTSVSLSPPLVLVCIKKGGSAHDQLLAAGSFGVSVLGAEQVWIAEQFARPGVDRFQGVPISRGRQAPLVEGALAHLECCHHALYEAGDHTIVVGEVLEIAAAPGAPLLYFNRQFGSFVSSHVSRSSVMSVPRGVERP